MGKIFVTDRANKGLEVVAGKYQFIDGIMPVSDSEAEMLKPILCRFYGCTLEDASVADQKKVDAVDPSLLASQTKAAELAGSGFSTEAMIEAGKAAGDPNVTGTLSGSGRVIGDEPSANTAPGGSSDPKEVTDQSVDAERSNQVNTGGVGTEAITGAVHKPATEEADSGSEVDHGNGE